MEKKFLVCPHCGNIVGVIADSGVTPVCCGEEMKVMEPNTADAAQEKHVPVLTVEGNIAHVTVGSAEHPMTDAHSIKWVCIVTDKGTQRKALAADGKPEADFALLEGEKVEAVYAYCNLHGLWKA